MPADWGSWVSSTAIQAPANFLNELCIPVVLLRQNIVCELAGMSDRKRGRTAQPRPIFVTRYNAFRDRFTGGPCYTGGRLTLGFPRCTFCLTIYQPEAIHSGALQPITKQHGWMLGLPPGYLPMACSKCKVAKTWARQTHGCTDF